MSLNYLSNSSSKQSGEYVRAYHQAPTLLCGGNEAMYMGLNSHQVPLNCPTSDFGQNIFKSIL